VLGSLSPVHDALHEVVDWHRWLGSREIGRPITGAANLGFLGLVVLGVTSGGRAGGRARR
jgi:hypothetical protein